MLSQRAEEYRSQAMLQSYTDAFPDLSYSHINMPPAGDYSMVTPPDQSWYNTYIHGGMQNGGETYARDTKPPSEWNTFSDDSSYIPQQLNNNNSDGGQFPSMQMMRQPLPMDSPIIMSGRDLASTSQDSLLINDDIITNGVDSNTMETPPASIMSIKQEQDCLPPIVHQTENGSAEVNKDMMKLPGFHQTFGNITEIGRFSQPDDFFEPPPSEPDPPKITEPIEQPKRKPRGRKRKQPEPRGDIFQRPNYMPEPLHTPQYMNTEPPPPYTQWGYQNNRQQHHFCNQNDHYHNQGWRPHPYNPYHHHHIPPPPPHHHYSPQPPPPPPPNMYQQQYQHDYPSYNNYPPYQNNWPNREYIHNYSGYV